MLIRLMIFSSALALAACGRSSPAAPAAEIELLRVLASGVATDTETYGVRATSMADRAACRAARAGYEEQVRPRIERMVAIAPRVDRWLQARGPSEHVDTECATSTMQDELDRHLAIACSFSRRRGQPGGGGAAPRCHGPVGGPRDRPGRGGRGRPGPGLRGARRGWAALRPVQRRERDVPALIAPRPRPLTAWAPR